MKFASRGDAGYQLGQHLLDRAVKVDLVVGLPRGGVVVAADVARVLQCPLDTLVVRKIGHPWHREFAIGAMAEKGVVILDEQTFSSDPLTRERVCAVVREETERLQTYERKFHFEFRLNFDDRRVLLIDDGLATGATAQAAVLSARKQGAQEVIVAAPVASDDAVARLKRAADAVYTLFVDACFQSVGQYYDEFQQTNDEEVIALLATSRMV
jgi:predicted phosphoribosyltransferase